MFRYFFLKNYCTLIFTCMLISFSISTIHAANYTYDYLDVPYASNSSAQAINNSKSIVGTHKNSADLNSTYFYQNGTYTDLTISETCVNTVFGFSSEANIQLLPLGLNDSNTIVGKIDSCGKVEGFKLIDGIYDVINWAQFPGLTQINDINNNGIMVGTVNLNYSSQINFMYNDFYFTKLSHTATAINNNNYIVGDNMIYDSIAYQSTKVTFAGTEWIELTGINNVGQIAGIAFNNAGKIRKSFVYDSTGFSVIDYPGSQWTIVTGLNDQGVVSGWASLPEYHDSVTGAYLAGSFSFTATPINAPNPDAILPLPVDAMSPAISFEPAVNVELSEAEIGPTLVADFNHDGKDDLVMAHTLSGKLKIYFGDSSDKPVFNDSKQIGKNGFYSVGYMSSLEKADFNGDGNLDLVIGSQQCNNDNRFFMVAKGQGDGSFTDGACLMMTPHIGFHDSFVFDIAVADFNQDSFQDIVVSTNGNYGAKQVLIYLGYGDMSFSDPSEIFNAGVTTSRPYALHASDINNDGFIDLIVETSRYFNSTSTLYLGNGFGQFPTAVAYQQKWPQTWPDMNNDTYPDRIYSVNGLTMIYFGNISGDFNYMPQKHQLPSVSLNGELKRITGDFNGDGLSDIFVADRNWGENVRGKMYFQYYQATVPVVTNPVTAPISLPTPTPNPNPITQPLKKPKKVKQYATDIKGEISAKFGNTITVNFINIEITNKTLQIFEDGTLGYLAVGQMVNVQTYQDSNGNLIATEIGVTPI